MDKVVVDSVKQALQLGKEQYYRFQDERFIKRSVPISEPIKRNKLALFQFTKVSNKTKPQLAILKDDCALFSRLYIACQSREGNLDEFFKYENQPYPPALAKNGEMRSGTKADLLSVLESHSRRLETTPRVTVNILDGAMLVQMLQPRGSKTFQDYADNVFLSHLSERLIHVKRLDLIWDRYITDSLKSATRERRGHGSRRRVTSSNRVPNNWQSFLRVDENKTELFQFLAQQSLSLSEDGKEIYCTSGEQVLCAPPRIANTIIEPCTHEEADTRMVLHLYDAALSGHRSIMITASDTDVLVIILSNFHRIPGSEIWMLFGVGKHQRYIAVHEIANSLGPMKCRSMSIFHALTGCDVTSFFCGRGKKSAWDTWDVYPDITNMFLELSDAPIELTGNNLNLCERFVILMYDRTSGGS